MLCGRCLRDDRGQEHDARPAEAMRSADLDEAPRALGRSPLCGAVPRGVGVVGKGVQASLLPLAAALDRTMPQW